MALRGPTGLSRVSVSSLLGQADWTGVLQVVLSEGVRVAGASRGPELLCANLKGWGPPAPQAGPGEECTCPPAAALAGGSSQERWER